MADEDNGQFIVNDLKLDSDGVRELLNSEECKDVILAYAQACKPKMDGFVADAFHGKIRANARITAVYPSAIRETYDNNVLLKAIKREDIPLIYELEEYNGD